MSLNVRTDISPHVLTIRQKAVARWWLLYQPAPISALTPFRTQDDLDLHIALGVENDVFDAMLAKGQAQGIEVRGPVDLFPRSQRLCRRADHLDRRAARNNGPRCLEAARSAGPLAGEAPPGSAAIGAPMQDILRLKQCCAITCLWL
jgi:hypothetical protein